MKNGIYQVDFAPGSNSIRGTLNSLQGAATLSSLTLLTPRTASMTTGYNYQCARVIDNYRSWNEGISERVRDMLGKNPDFRSNYFRQRAIDKAWEMERIDVEWGGRGSERWNRAERKEILRYGRIRQERVEGRVVKEYPGHHQKSVKFHPEEQANPDNIKFFRSRKSHLMDGHGGDYKQESDAPLIDRAKMVKRTNFTKRVLKNEVFGAGLTAIIAFATSTSISFILECAKNGWAPEERKKALQSSAKAGGEATALAMTCYGVSRIVVEAGTNATVKLIERVFNGTVSEAGREFIGGSIVAVISVVIVATYTYHKLRKAGVSKSDAFAQVMTQSIKSLLVAILILVIKNNKGNAWAFVAGFIIAAFSVAYQYYMTNKEKELLEKVNAIIMDETYDLCHKRLLRASA